MGLNIQIVVDCKNPHDLADWWAETLGWAVEPQDEAFIRSMIEQGFATEAETKTHNGKLVWRDRRGHPPGRGARRQAARAPHPVPDGPGGERPSRTGCTGTCALRAGTRTRSGTELEARGATFLWTANEGPHEWHTMADPEGNEFCIS